MRTASLLLVAGLLVAGCGDDPADETSSTTATSAAAGDSTEEFPVTVEHAHGSTEIPEAPERVVTVGYNDQDPVLALGVVPVGVMRWYDDDPLGFSWTLDAYGDQLPEDIGSDEFLVPNFEAVAALEPDLIVAVSGTTEESYELLSQIAPTIAQIPGEADYSSASWQENQRLVGQALGRSERAEEVIAEVEAAIAATRAQHPEFAGATALVAGVYEGQYQIRGRNEIWSEFLLELGFDVPEAIVPDDFTEISAEAVGSFADLDALIWLALPEEVDNPAYPTLAVAQAGRDVFVESLGELSGAIGFNSALSLPYVLEELVPRLALAIDGDPATEVPVAA